MWYSESATQKTPYFDGLHHTIPFNISKLVVSEFPFEGGEVFSIKIMLDLKILDMSFVVRQYDFAY